jgi:Na+-driven multidrug efflux pump
VPIAAHQVLTQLWMLSSFLLDSLAVGGQTLVAVHVGRDAAAAREISDRLLEARVLTTRCMMSSR